MKTSWISAALAALILFGSSLLAAPGDLDPGFAPSADGTVTALAVQPDGRILIGGAFAAINGTPRPHLARLEATGALDATFAPAVDGPVSCLAVQADGRIVIAGSFTTVAGSPRFSLTRLNADGTLDATFNANVFAAGNQGLNSLWIDPAGRILVCGGFVTVDGLPRRTVARLLPDGTVDPTFDTGTGANGSALSMAVQEDGRILIGGVFSTVNGLPRQLLARLNIDGSVDPGFQPAWGATLVNSSVSAITVQRDGRIVVAGRFEVFPATLFGLARLLSTGQPDSLGYPFALSIVSTPLQTDGRLLRGGFTTDAASGRRLGRLLATGAEDTAFDPAPDGAATAVAVQADGRVLLAGSFATVDGQPRQSLARLENGPAPQSLTAPTSARLQWWRNGAGPETQQVTFDLSTDGGANWTSLGPGTRIAGGWEKTGLSLPGSGLLRARARTVGGQSNGSSGLVETIAAFPPAFVRDVLISDFNNGRVLRYDTQTGVFIGTFVANGGGGLTGPMGHGVDSNGSFLVCDHVHGKVRRYHGITGSFIDDYLVAVAPASLVNAVSVRTSDGSHYVLQAESTKMSKFSVPAGTFNAVVFTASFAQVDVSRGFVVDPASGDFLVTGNNHKVARFARDTGAFLGHFINSSGASSVLLDPRGIEIGPDGAIWIASRGTNKIVRFRVADGSMMDDNYLPTGSTVTGPTTILFDGDLVYVLSSGNHSVYRFSLTDQLLLDASSPFINAAPQTSGMLSYMSLAPANYAPTADAGANQSVPEGSVVTLTGLASADPESQPLTYLWSQVSGPAATLNNAQAQQPTFTAPQVSPSGGQMVFKLVVNDGRQNSAEDFVTIHIANVNQPPVANAGPDRTEPAYSLITLDGTGSADPDSAPSPLSYAWSQLSGPPAPLTNPASAQPTVTVPAYLSGSLTLVFRLAVDDGQSTAQDTVTLTIDPPFDNDRDGLPDSWETLHGLNPTTDTDVLLDPDLDSRRNLLEWAFATSASAPDSTTLAFTANTITRHGDPIVSVIDSAFQATYLRRRPMGEVILNYTVEFSPDLSEWVTSTATPTVRAEDQEVELVTIPFPTEVNGRPARFFRVRVTAEPVP